MKRFFRFIFYSGALILLAGITSLYFGWIRFDAPGSYRGVIYYKSSGYQSSLLTPFQWYWNAQNILPGNTTIYVIDTAPQRESFLIAGHLPSADLYSNLLDSPKGSSAFDYQVEISYEYKLKEEELVKLYQSSVLSDSLNLSPIKEAIAKNLKEKVNTRLDQLITEQRTPTLTVLSEELGTQLRLELEASFPYLKNVELQVEAKQFPDLTLYATAQGLMQDILEQKQTERRAEEIRQARGASEEENRLMWLEKYGKLLKEYPELESLLTSNNAQLFSFFRED